MSSQNNSKFRTPYRHRALDTGSCLSSQASCSDSCGTTTEQDWPGDMLDLIRSQKSSQHQSTPAIKKRRPGKVPKRQLFHENITTSSKEPCPVSEPKTRKESNNLPAQKEALVPRYIQALAKNQQTRLNLDARPVLPPSEVYEFPLSPTSGTNLGISRKRRLVEAQALRTIRKMTEEIQYFRQRKEELRREYPELCR